MVHSGQRPANVTTKVVDQPPPHWCACISVAAVVALVLVIVGQQNRVWREVQFVEPEPAELARVVLAADTQEELGADGGVPDIDDIQAPFQSSGSLAVGKQSLGQSAPPHVAEQRQRIWLGQTSLGLGMDTNTDTDTQTDTDTDTDTITIWP